MTTYQYRFALLAGASASAMVLTAPAQAQQVRPGPEAPTGRVVIGENVEDTLVITLAGEEATFGVIERGTPFASAFVFDPSTGQVRQVGIATGTPPDGGNVDLLMTNAGDVEVVAIAEAEYDAGGATAEAIIFRGYRQDAEGAGDVTVEIRNTGTMGTNALATANAAGHADAFAFAPRDRRFRRPLPTGSMPR